MVSDISERKHLEDERLRFEQELRLAKKATAWRGWASWCMTRKTGTEAVEVFRQHQDTIRVVICDLR